jgi:hypothetical protein
MGFYSPRSWCRTRAATASRCGRRTSAQRLGNHAGRETAKSPSASACIGSTDLERGSRRTRVAAAAPVSRRRRSRPPRGTRARATSNAGRRRRPGRARRPPPAGRLGRRRRADPARPAARSVRSRNRPAACRAREGEEIVADYSALGLTLGRHPLTLLRARLEAQALPHRRTLRTLEHNRPARCAGIVTCRQRPGTASGVIFLTLEDETGCANVLPQHVTPAVPPRRRRDPPAR